MNLKKSSAALLVAAALAGRPGIGREVSPTTGALAIGAVLPVRDARCVTPPAGTTWTSRLNMKPTDSSRIMPIIAWNIV